MEQETQLLLCAWLFSHVHVAAFMHDSNVSMHFSQMQKKKAFFLKYLHNTDLTCHKDGNFLGNYIGL